MFTQAEKHYAGILSDIAAAGLTKDERIIQSPQGASIEVNGKQVLNFCANNYLGLANHPTIVAAAREALGDRGYGLSSVRFICGTQDLHKRLEAKLSEFLGAEDTILYSSCFDANGGLFETLLGAEDAIISDALNHASIIDGIRLCKARRLRYDHADMAQLEAHLQQSQDCRVRLIATDGVFSMDGDIAPLPTICDLAEKYQAMVMVDDSHATGFVGKTGRGTIEHHGVAGRVDIVTSTLGLRPWAAGPPAASTAAALDRRSPPQPDFPPVSVPSNSLSPGDRRGGDRRGGFAGWQRRPPPAAPAKTPRRRFPPSAS